MSTLEGISSILTELEEEIDTLKLRGLRPDQTQAANILSFTTASDCSYS